ncbi:unnamed protein product [Sphagnum troendelagicum]|uniref:F-box domain-containing protein n=1 Tax=Sphagnum troendelagicum TaxID=128251 RepID=A0ABP0T7F2_9BRYO
MTSSLETLPPELIRSILTYLSPEDTSALAQTCHRMNVLTRDDKLWRQHFFNRYTYPHRISIQFSRDGYQPGSVRKVLQSPPDGCSWQDYFVQRARKDNHIRHLLNEIVSTRKNRLGNAELISSTYSLGALDVLKQYFPPSVDTSKDQSTSVPLESRSLSREYYSLEISGLISRQSGLSLLHEIQDQTTIPTEGRALINALFSIQCFYPRGIYLSLNRLHLIGQHLLNDPTFQTLTVSEKCERILATMKTEQFLPAKDGHDYYNVENGFIGSAFSGKPTIPLTLVSIYCALAEECGLTARPVGFPGEVMAQVDHSSSSDDLSDETISLFISVFEGKIITLAEINDRLVDVTAVPITLPLAVTPIVELVSRSARNMINCLVRRSTSPFNPYALYASVAVLNVLGGGALPFAFYSIMDVLKEQFPFDIRFLETLPPSSTASASDDLSRIRNEDSNPPAIEPKRRSSDSPVTFRIGEIFQHRHYSYWAVICGWDSSCLASSTWQLHMGVSNLARGASQPFYHVLVDDSSRRYVAEENINTVGFTSLTDEEEKRNIIRNLCAVPDIGKHFERVDITNAKFIPTPELRDEYPDDFV